jgi:hypothetical protein
VSEALFHPPEQQIVQDWPALEAHLAAHEMTQPVAAAAPVRRRFRQPELPAAHRRLRLCAAPPAAWRPGPGRQ